MITIHGAPISPYVRKTMSFCYEKGIEFKNVPMAPTPKTPEFLSKSPIGKIPFLEDDGFFLPDSSAICLYLEKVHPEKPLYPSDPKDYGRVLFFEEYADTKLIEVTGALFFEMVIAPKFFGRPTDEAKVQTILTETQPAVFGYLESVVKGPHPIVGESLTVADLAMVGTYSALLFIQKPVDGGRWPKLAAYFEWLIAKPSVQKALQAGLDMMKPPA